MSQRLLSLLLTSRLVRLSDLEITYSPEEPASEEEGEAQLKAYWTLYIDLICISHTGTGSVFDACWLAIYAALQDTLLPKPHWGIDEAAVFCDPDIQRSTKLRLRGTPTPLSFGVFEETVLVDLDAMEEECCTEQGCVVVDGDSGDIVRVEKWGGGVVGGKELVHIVRLAGERCRAWKKVVEGKS